jgi:hypothetical protein
MSTFKAVTSIAGALVESTRLRRLGGGGASSRKEDGPPAAGAVAETNRPRPPDSSGL